MTAPNAVWLIAELRKFGSEAARVEAKTAATKLPEAYGKKTPLSPEPHDRSYTVAANGW